MTTIGQLERATQNRVVMLLVNQLGWQYIQVLKSGDNLDQVIIADLNTSKVSMIDALLLAKNGFVVPDGNIVYDFSQQSEKNRL
jgi:hypothetical protein